MTLERLIVLFLWGIVEWIVLLWATWWLVQVFA
jgi:hypothetical protein